MKLSELLLTADPAIARLAPKRQRRLLAMVDRLDRQLKQPEGWQVEQAYRQIFNAGLNIVIGVCGFRHGDIILLGFRYKDDGNYIKVEISPRGGIKVIKWDVLGLLVGGGGI